MGDRTAEARTAATVPVEDLGPAHPPLLPPRYDDLGLIGAGGMGEVRRVWDRELERALAMKILRWSPELDEAARRRFVTESKITAGLQHPGVIAVYDHGELADGRPYLTLKEVRGRTFDALLAAPLDPVDPLLSLRRVIDRFRAVCQTVAYAHQLRVVHRDLKPSNLMVGEHDEVLVLDWGLAARLSEQGAPEPPPDHALGTPGFVAPERLEGAPIAPNQDVYALGCVLYEILSGRRPYPGAPDQVIARQRVEDPPPARVAAGSRPAPEELCRLVEIAMARDPARRFQDAAPLAEGLRAWLEGARRVALAEARVAEADALRPKIHALRRDAAQLRAQAEAWLSDCQPHEHEARKRPGWDLEDRARALELEATQVETEWASTLYGALSRVPELTSAHARLAEHYQEQAARAEAARDEHLLIQAESQLRRHDRGRFAAFLAGHSQLSLRTEPEGARLSLRRFERHGRRLALGPAVDLGVGPLHDHGVPQGSYLLTANAPGFAPTHLPLLLPRGAPWRGAAPGTEEAEPLRLLPEGALGPDDVHVPAGWFRAGGDPEAADGLPEKTLWLESFIIKRFPVTCQEYLIFLDDLVARGRDAEAEALVPREMAQGEGDRPLLWRDAQGRYRLPEGPGEAAWDPAWPVTMVSWYGATAYAQWLADAEGLPWRLPHDLEWEKAARGVDGRLFPWGDHPDPTWANMINSAPTPPLRAPVRSFPVDSSPYGVRGLAGNVRDWCANAYARGGPAVVHDRPVLEAAGVWQEGFRMVRGGCWASTERHLRAAVRFAARPGERHSVCGFRLARSLSPA